MPESTPAVAVPVEPTVRPQPPAGTSECCTCGYRWRTGQHGGHSCAQQLREELDVTDKLLATRDALLRSIPECEHHGDQCVPHATAWVQNSIRIRACAAAVLAAFDGDDQLARVDALIALRELLGPNAELTSPQREDQ